MNNLWLNIESIVKDKTKDTDMTKIVAFLPNQTFPRDVQTEYLVKYMTDNVFRRRKFQVSYLGAWLLKTFGEETFNKIIWDSLLVNIGDHSVNRCTEEVIKYHNPDLILVFSTLARVSVELSNNNYVIIDCTSLLNLSNNANLVNLIKTKITELERG